MRSNIKIAIFLFIILIFSVSTSHGISTEYLQIVNSKSYSTSFNSPVFKINNHGFSVYAKWDETVATLSGTIKVQASCDGSNWEDITGGSETISGSGAYLWNISDVQYLYARVVYTQSSGTGTFYVVANNK